MESLSVVNVISRGLSALSSIWNNLIINIKRLSYYIDVSHIILQYLLTSTATIVLDTKICNVLRQYLKDGDTSIRELPVHVVYYAISHVLKENNIPVPDKDLLIDHLRQVFPIDNCPIILVPLLHNATIHRNRWGFKVSAMLW